jgi:hypothetical protein
MPVYVPVRFEHPKGILKGINIVLILGTNPYLLYLKVFISVFAYTKS